MSQRGCRRKTRWGQTGLGRVITGACVCVALGVALGACSDPEPGCGPSSAMVARIIDGDTIEIEGGERVRYLMIDTPELSTSACYAPEARDFNFDLVAGQRVALEYDVQCRDNFGRLLAYVSVQGREVNSLLVERGYACVLYIPPNGTDRRAEFENLQLAAEANARGMWAACPGVSCPL